MFEKGKIVSDFDVVDAAGETHRLWDFRNRTHVAVVVGKDSSDRDRALASAAEFRKTWDWLGLRFFSASPSLTLSDPGIYAIDRFGAFIAYVPFDADAWEKLEKEVIYHDAKHC